MKKKGLIILLLALSIIITSVGCTIPNKSSNTDGSTDISEQQDQRNHQDDKTIDPAVPAGSLDVETAVNSNQETSHENVSVVELTGSYTRFDEIKGFNGDYQFLSMVGEADGYIIMEYMPDIYKKEDKPSLMLVDINTLEAEKIIEMDSPIPDMEPNPISHIKMVGDKIIVCSAEHISVMNNALELIKEIPLPEAIIRRSKRTQTFDKDGIMEVYYSGYDISSDMEQIVYADEAGIKLYNLRNDTEILLTKNIYNKDNLKRYFYEFPRFIANDKKIIANKLGYEYSLGCTIYDIANNSIKTLNLFSERGPNYDINYDTGLLEPGIKVYNEELDDYEWKKIYLDFMTGDVTEIQVERDIYEHYDFQYNQYVGDNYAAFATYVPNENEAENVMYYISRINLKTLEIESDLLAIRSGGPHIMGVLTDGRVLFRYYYNESENGVCIAG